ncbi:MAG: hypothetical protein AB7F28_07705 [Candidatus Margulisiibacteriota bacterium]
MNLLYRYLVAPCSTLEANGGRVPMTEGLVVVGLLALSWCLTPEIGGYFTLALLSALSVGAFILIGVFIQAVTLDFVAQWMGFKAQSKALFAWFCLGLMPLLLGGIIGVFEPFLPTLVGMIHLGLCLGVMVLQWQTLRVLYGASPGKTTVIYLFPGLIFLLISVFLTVLLMGVGVASMASVFN